MLKKGLAYPLFGRIENGRHLQYPIQPQKFQFLSRDCFDWVNEIKKTYIEKTHSCWKGWHGRRQPVFFQIFWIASWSALERRSSPCPCQLIRARREAAEILPQIARPAEERVYDPSYLWLIRLGTLETFAVWQERTRKRKRKKCERETKKKINNARNDKGRRIIANG